MTKHYLNEISVKDGKVIIDRLNIIPLEVKKAKRSSFKEEPTNDEIHFLMNEFLRYTKERGFDNNPQDSYNAVSEWYARIIANEFFDRKQTAKGLFIFGNTGSGKTTMTNLIVGAIKQRRFRSRKWLFRSVEDYLSYHSKFDYPDWIECEERMFGNWNTVIDDFGRNLSLNKYGNEFDIEPVIEMRYRAFQRTGAVTVFTSNARNYTDVEKLYSTSRDEQKNGRIVSRITEICDFLLVSFPDRRRSNTQFLNRKYQ